MNITALDGTVALITGATSGIGDATARQQAEHGASVVVAARARAASTRSSRSSRQRAVRLWRSRPTSPTATRPVTALSTCNPDTPPAG
jgi:NAD(P)-dependent dehydrogenase (short-subunit alcohol dehydrogenase family)